jgi:hypothetical protein
VSAIAIVSGHQIHVGVQFVLNLPWQVEQRTHLALVVAKLEPHFAAPVPEIGHSAVIADRCNLARHVEQLLAQAPDIHQDDDRREWPAPSG